MGDGWLRLHGLEEEASAWLTATSDFARVPTVALFDAFLHILRLRHADIYDIFVPINEAMLESLLCMSRGHFSMPLPLPESRDGCACAHMTGVRVNGLFLSGSARENCSVSLMDSCASDVDMMLQLGGITVVEEEAMGRPGRPSNTTATVADGESRTTDSCGFHQAVKGASCSEEIPVEGASCSEEIQVVGGQGAGATDGDSGAASGEEANVQEMRDDCGLGERDGGGGGRKTDGAEASAGLEEIVVSMERTERPGFFLLRHRRQPSCRHHQSLPLSARRVVDLIDTLRQSVTCRPPSFSGPAVSATVSDFSRNAKDVDLVACLRCPAWPHCDFASRQRQSGWPDASLVALLCRTATFLVPVGFPGSATEKMQWRLSFSRHEYIVLRRMTADQRMCLTALKYCRAVIGEAVKPLKSYYLKTALMWLTESRAADQWTTETMHDSLLLILRYLDVCISRGFLPCYFWPEVNLLASRSAEERAELAGAVAELRRRLVPAVLGLLADWLGVPVPTLAERLLLHNERLNTEQFFGMTLVNAVSQALGRPLSQMMMSSSSAEDGSDNDNEESLFDAWLNFEAYGRNLTAGSIFMNLPVFPGASLHVDVFERFAWQGDIIRTMMVFPSMLQRGIDMVRDSWLEDAWDSWLEDA